MPQLCPRVRGRGGGSGCPVPGGAAAAPALRGSAPCGAERYPLTCSVLSAEGRWHCRAVPSEPVASRLPRFRRRFSGSSAPAPRWEQPCLSCGWGEGGGAVRRGCSWPPGMLEPLGMFDSPPPVVGVPFGCSEPLDAQNHLRCRSASGMLSTPYNFRRPLRGCSDALGDARVLPGMLRTLRDVRSSPGMLRTPQRCSDPSRPPAMLRAPLDRKSVV